MIWVILWMLVGLFVTVSWHRRHWDLCVSDVGIIFVIAAIWPLLAILMLPEGKVLLKRKAQK